MALTDSRWCELESRDLFAVSIWYTARTKRKKSTEVSSRRKRERDMQTPGSVLIAHFAWLYFGKNLSLVIKIRSARHWQPRPPGAAPNCVRQRFTSYDKTTRLEEFNIYHIPHFTISICEVQGSFHQNTLVWFYHIKTLVTYFYLLV